MPDVKSLLSRTKAKALELKERRFPTQYPDLDEAFVPVGKRISQYSMTTTERQYSLWKAIEHIEKVKVPGDIVECGVWRGGSSMLIALALQANSTTDRDLWLYDTFEGMSSPSEHDVDPQGARMIDEWDSHDGKVDDPVFAFGSLDEVKANMASTGYPAARLHFLQGKVEETIPQAIPEKISLLRLDTDWYESTKHELEHLWPLLEVGGVLLIDDYGHWAGARKAVDEFFDGRSDAPLLNRVDYSARIGVKTA